MGAALCALSLFCAVPDARAQSADVVLCDRLAADPDDPDRPKDLRGVRTIAPDDIATAIRFCRTGSASGPRRTLHALGRAYAAGGQMPEAAGAFRRAADKGSSAAMVELGVMLANGAGVAKDEEQARRLFERAAAAGNPRGMTSLAALSERGGGAGMDPVKARALLADAAEKNFPAAQFQLGQMLADGAGGPRDDAAARGLFERAAAQGHAGALERMGEFAQTGRGGPKDTDAAKAYYEKAAALGSEEAKAALKRMNCPIAIRDKRGNFVSNLCF